MPKIKAAQFARKMMRFFCHVIKYTHTHNHMEPLHSFSANHAIFKCTVRTLLELNIENWHYNRPADVDRAGVIAEYIFANPDKIDWMLYLVKDDNVPNKYQIIDGLHRYTAFCIIARENARQPDFMTPGKFDSKDHATRVFNQWVFLSIRTNVSEGHVIDVFQSLNKSAPISLLYITDVNEEKRRYIERLAETWKKTYPDHFSSSKTPNIPNINIDTFKNVLLELYGKLKLTTESAHLLDRLLQQANNYLHTNIPTKTSEKMREKCAKNGCYLFLVPAKNLETYLGKCANNIEMC